MAKYVEINGTKYNPELMKGYTKEKFMRQNKNKFKDPEVQWDMIKDKMEVKESKKKANRSSRKVEDKLDQEKVEKTEKD